MPRTNTRRWSCSRLSWEANDSWPCKQITISKIKIKIDRLLRLIRNWHYIIRYILNKKLFAKETLIAALLSISKHPKFNSRKKNPKFKWRGRKLPQDNNYAAHFQFWPALWQWSYSNDLSVKQVCALLVGIGDHPPIYMDRIGCSRPRISHKSWPQKQSSDPSIMTEAQKALILLANNNQIMKLKKISKQFHNKEIKQNPSLKASIFTFFNLFQSSK